MQYRWKLREIMARYNITGVALAEEMNITPVAMSNMRRGDKMPRLDGERIEKLTTALSKLANTKISFYDLFEEIEVEQANFKTFIAA